MQLVFLLLHVSVSVRERQASVCLRFEGGRGPAETPLLILYVHVIATRADDILREGG